VNFLFRAIITLLLPVLNLSEEYSKKEYMLGKKRITLAEGTGLKIHSIELRPYLDVNFYPEYEKTRRQKQLLCVIS
jgi:hypothetical protein